MTPIQTETTAQTTAQQLNGSGLDCRTGSHPGSKPVYRRSTLWISDSAEPWGHNPIATVTLEEFALQLTLYVQITELNLIDLSLQVTPETLLLRGDWNQFAQVEAHFCPAPFRSLIPLPHPVLPEATRAEQQDDRLIVYLTRQPVAEPPTASPFQVSLQPCAWMKAR